MEYHTSESLWEGHSETESGLDFFIIVKILGNLVSTRSHSFSPTVK